MGFSRQEYWSGVPLPSPHIPWGNHNWKRHMYPNVCCSTIYIAMTWRQPRCPLTDKWIKKVWHIYTMEYYSAIKRNTFESLLMMWMNLEPVTESEVRKKKTNIVYFAPMWNLERWHGWTYLQGSSVDTDIESRCVDIEGRGKERVWEHATIGFIKSSENI